MPAADRVAVVVFLLALYAGASLGAQNPETRRVADLRVGWAPLYPVEQTMSGVASTDHFHGLSVHVAIPQCNPGHDRFSLLSSLGGNTSQYSSNFDACAFFFSRHANGSYFRTVARYLHFHPAAPSVARTQVTFGWVLWLTLHEYSLVDVETRHVWFRLDPNDVGPKTWRDGETTCAGSHPGVHTSAPHLPTVISDHEHLLMMKFQNIDGSGTALDKAAVYFARDNNLPAAKFRWRTGETIGIQAWLPSRPDNAGGNELYAGLRFADAGWNDFDTSATFDGVICEADDYANFAGQISYIVDPAVALAGQEAKTLQPPVPLNRLPLNPVELAVPVFGATVMTAVSECTPTDRWWVNRPHDHITALNSADPLSNCRLYLGGEAFVSNYNDVLVGLWWSTNHTERHQLRHGYVYWTSPRTRYAITDMSGFVAFMSAGVTYHTPAASFSLRSGSDVCGTESMVLAEPDSELAVRELEYSVLHDFPAWQSDTASWLQGIRWNSGSNVFEKPSSAIRTLDYFGWMCARPSGSRVCTVLNAFGRWDDAACATTLVTGVVCSRADHPFTNSISDAVRFSTVVHPQTKRRDVVSDTIVDEADLVRFPDFYVTYGFTVQLSISQCETGDSISASIPTANAALIRRNSYNAASCTRNVRYVTGGAFANITKTLISRTRLSYVDLSRLQFHVGWHILTDERVAEQADDVFMDVESQLLYAWLPQQTAAWSWDGACRACTEMLGAPFELTSVMSPVVEKLMHSSRDPFLPSPIRARREGDQSNAEFLWLVHGTSLQQTRDKSLYVNRMPEAGPGSAGDLCLANTRGGARVTEWGAVRCDPPANSPPNFVVAFCRRPSRHYFSGTSSLMSDTAFHARPFFGKPFPVPGMLPGSLSQENIYGATISVSKFSSADTAACLSTSTWYFPSASHDHIGVLRNEPCAIFFAGLATVAEYSTLLQDLEFRTTLPSPSTAWFGYVYWSTRHLRELILSPQTSRVFAVVRTNTRWVATAAYPYWAAWQYCQRFAMDAYEVHSLTENEDVLALRSDIANRSDYLIGVTAAGGSYRWFSNAAMTYTNFVNRHDALTVVGGQECATLTAWGSWRNVACDRFVPGGIACRATGLTYLHAGRRQSPIVDGNAPSLPNLESRRRLLYSTSWVYSMFQASDLAWLPTTQTIYGATAQLSPRQCQGPTDTFEFRSSTYRNQIRISHFADACATFLRHRTAESFAVSHLNAYLPHLVMYTGDRTRRQLTFALSVWIDPRVQWLLSDVDTKHAYVRLDTAFYGSWQQVADRCGAVLSSSWSMIAPNTEPEARFLSATVPTSVLLLRNTSGAFVWGRDIPFVFSALTENSDTSKLCAVASSGSTWGNTACAEAMQSSTVMCEANSWNATAFVWLSLAEDAEATAYRQKLPLNFPADTTPDPTTVSGVTVQVARRECLINDRYVFDYGFNTLQLNYADACTLMLSGSATVAQYNHALRGVFHRSSEHRTWISFRSMYWLRDGLDRILYSFAADDDRVFAVVAGETTFTPSTGYPYYGAAYLCSAFGGLVAAVPSATANDDVQAIAKPTTNFLGARRSGTAGTGDFEWAHNPTPISYTPYIYGTLGPEPTPAYGCMTITPSGLWRTADCTAPTRDGVVCEFTSWQMVAKTNISFMPDRDPLPTTNRTRDRIMAFDSLGKSLVFDESDLSTFNSGTQCYGATVQLNVQQVLAGDAFEFDTSTDTGIRGFQPTLPPQCTLCLYTSASRLTENFRAVLRTVKFAPVQRSRTQLQFSYILWLHPKSTVSTSFPSMLFDAETRHAYSFFELSSSQRWAETLSTCRNLGPHWDLPTVNTPSENALLRTFQRTGADPAFPLRASRTGAGRMMWDNGDRVTFADWNVDSTGMRNSSVECLSMLGSTQPASNRGHMWDAISCSAQVLPTVVCETSEYTTFGVVSYLGAKNFNPSGVVLRSLVPSADLAAAGLDRVVYGLTVQSHRSDCRSTDGFLSTASDAFVFVAYNDPCSIMFGGTATVRDYTRFVDGVLWTTVYSNRTAIRFGAVLWATQYVGRLAVDFSRQSAFFLNIAESQFVPSAPFMPNASGLCTQNGMRLAQLETSEAADAFESLERTQDTTIGLQRRIVGLVDGWHHVPGNTLATHTRWLRDEPITGNDCARLATWNVWISVGCAIGVPATGCEITTWPVPLIFRTMALPSENVDRRRDRYRTFDYAAEGSSAPTMLLPFVNTSLTDLEWLDPTAVLYGVTVQLSAEQCTVGDIFSLDRVALPDTTYELTAVPNTCISRLVHKAPQPPNAWAASTFYPALDAVQFKPAMRGRIRRQLAFGYVLWTNELALNLALDLSTGRVLTTSQPEPSALLLTRSWDESWAFCRRLGPTWSLPSVTSLDALKTLHAQLTNTAADVPLAMRRTPSQTFVWTDMGPQNVLPWLETAPGATAQGNCTFSSTTSAEQLARFSTLPCSDTVFIEVLCEAAQWQGSGIITYVRTLPPNASATFFPLVPDTAIASSAGDAYGATVQVRLLDCRVSDTVYTTANYDGIVVSTSTPCLQHFSGIAPIDEYRRVIGETGIAAIRTSRTNVVAAAVLWPSPAVRFVTMAADLPDARYLVVPVFVGHGDATGRRSFASSCSELEGMQTAEVITSGRRGATQTAVAAATTWHDIGMAAVGLTRRSPLPDAVFVGESTRAAPSTSDPEATVWFAGEPAPTAGRDCVGMSASGMLSARACLGTASYTTVSVCGWGSPGYTDATFAGARVTTSRLNQPADQAGASDADAGLESATVETNTSNSDRLIVVSQRADEELVLVPFAGDPRLNSTDGAFGAALDVVHGVTMHLSQQACDRLPLNATARTGSGQAVAPLFRWNGPPSDAVPEGVAMEMITSPASPCWMSLRATTTMAATATLLRATTATLDFATHPLGSWFAGSIPSALSFGYIVWPATIGDASVALDMETGYAHLWFTGRALAPPTPFAAATRSAYHAACAGVLGLGASRVVEPTSISSERLTRAGIPPQAATTGDPVVLGLHRAATTGSFRLPSGRPVSLLRFDTSASEPAAAAGTMVAAKRDTLPHVVDSSKVAALGDSWWTVVDGTSAIATPDPTPLACEVEPRYVSDTVGGTTLRVHAVASVSNDTGAGVTETTENEPWGVVAIHAPTSQSGFELIQGPFDGVLPGDVSATVYGVTVAISTVELAGDAWLWPSHHVAGIATVHGAVFGSGVAAARGRAMIGVYNTLMQHLVVAFSRGPWNRYGHSGTMTNTPRVGFVYWTESWSHDQVIYHAPGGAAHHYIAVPTQVTMSSALQGRGLPSGLSQCQSLGLWESTVPDLAIAETVSPQLQAAGDLVSWASLAAPRIGVRSDSGTLRFIATGAALTYHPGQSLWLAEEPRSTTLTVMDPSGRWRGLTGNDVHTVACQGTSAHNYRRDVAVPNLPAPTASAVGQSLVGAMVAAETTAHTFVAASTGSLHLWPFANRTDPASDPASTEGDILAPLRSAVLPVVYGLSIQLDSAQCRGDRNGAVEALTIQAEPPLFLARPVYQSASRTTLARNHTSVPHAGLAAANASARYSPRSCVLTADLAETPQPVGDVVAILERVKFSSFDLSRTHLRFTYVLWESPRIGALVSDAASGTVTGRVNVSDVSFTRDGAAAACKSEGPRWSLARLPSLPLQDVVVSLSGGSPTFVGVHRTPRTGQRAFDDGSDVVAVRWAPGHPTSRACITVGPSAGGVTAAGDAEWSTVDCTDAVANVWCEVPLHRLRFAGSIHWEAAPREPTASTSSSSVSVTLSAAGLPAALTSLTPAAATSEISCFGVRGLVATRTCRDSDAWRWDAVDGRLSLRERTPCAVELVGSLALKEYVAVLPNVRHLRAQEDATRNAVLVNVIFYMAPQLVRVAAASETAYTGIRAAISINRAFAAYDDFNFCALYERTGVAVTWTPAILDTVGLAALYSQQVGTVAHRTALGATYNRTTWEWARGWSDRWNPPQFEASPTHFINGDLFAATDLGTSTAYGLAAMSFGQWTRVESSALVDSVACTTGEPYRFATAEASITVPTPAPAAATAAATRRLTVPLTPFKPIRAEELPTSLDNATLIHSAIVHVPIQQCVAGIDRVVVTADGCPFADLSMIGITAKSNDGDCSLHFAGPQNAGVYKALLADCTQYVSGATFKVQIAFAWAMSNQARLWHRMSYDMVSGKLYALLPLTAAATSWDGAAWSCRNLGPGWRLPAIANAAENSIVAGLAQAARADADLADAIDMTAFTTVPLGMVRNAEGTAVWTHKNTGVAFQNFDSGTTPTSGWDCFVMRHGSGTWVDSHCEAVPFPVIVCETQGYTLTGQLTYATAPSDLTPAQDLAVFQSGDLNENPGAANNAIFGAVVQISAQDSKPSDRLLAAEASDKILLVRVGAYVLQLVGQATIKEYNAVLSAVKLQTYNTERSFVRAGYLYYTSAAVTNAFIDLSRAPIANPAVWVPFFLPLTDVANPFTQMRAADFCAGLGLGMSVTTSAAQAAEQAVATVYPTTLLGTRPTVNGSFYNYDPNVVRNHGAACDACDPCVVLTMYGKWRPAPCSQPQSAIMCTGSASAGNFGFVTFPTNVVEPANVYADTTFQLPSTFASTGVVFPFASRRPWPNIPGGSEIFGLTLQVPLEQCTDVNTSVPLATNLTALHSVTEVPDDRFVGSFFALSTSMPGGALWGSKTVTRVLDGCVTYIAGSSSAGSYEVIAQSMLWATNEPAKVKSATFSASLWTDPRLTNVTFDWTDAAIFVGSLSPSPKSWFESYAECALLGPTWALPALVTPHHEHIASVLIFNQTVGIGALRAPSSPFSWTSGQIMALQRWSSSFPTTGIPDTDCAVGIPDYTAATADPTQPGARQWIDVNCEDRTVLRDAICRSSATDITFQFAFAGASAPVDVSAASFYLERVFKESQLPTEAKGALQGFGLTVQRNADACTAGDTFGWGSVSGRHALSYSRDGCIAWVVGRSNVSLVIRLLRDVSFWSTNPLTVAAQSRFGYVVWTRPQPLAVSIDVTTARHFVSVPFGARFTPQTAYPYGGAVETCATLGGALVEPPTALELGTALTAVPYTRAVGAPLVGVTRRNINGLLRFAYVSQDEAAYTKWSGRCPTCDPGTNAGDCVVANAEGTYSAIKCDAFAAAVLCVLDEPYPMIWPPLSRTATLPPTISGSETDPTPTADETASSSGSESREPSVSQSNTESRLSPSQTSSPNPTDTDTQSIGSSSPSRSDTDPVSPSDSVSTTDPSESASDTHAPTASEGSASGSESFSQSESGTPSGSIATATDSGSRTLPPTQTVSRSVSLSETDTVSPPPTRSPTPTTSLTLTWTVTPPPTGTATATVTPPPTRSRTGSDTKTTSVTLSPPPTPSMTSTVSESESQSLTHDVSPSSSFTLSESESPTTSQTASGTDSTTMSQDVTLSDSEPVSLSETRSVTDTLDESETTTMSDGSGTGSTSRSPTTAVTPTTDPTPSESADATLTASGSLSASPSLTETATGSQSASGTITPPPTPTRSTTFSMTESESGTVTDSLWPTGLLEYEATNITADGIQDGDYMWMEYTLAWDSWLCANLSINTVTIRSKQIGNAFGIGARSGQIFNQQSIEHCNGTVLRLRLQRDRSYDSYVAEYFTVTFEGATLRQVVPEPREIEFEIQPASVPNDVAAAVVAAQVSSQASLLGGPAASSNQALAIMGLSPCARPAMRIATEKAKESMVPVPLEDSYQGWFFGNFVLLTFVSVVHFPVVVVIREIWGVSWYDARELGVFPSVSITVTQILHAGIAYASINLVVWGTSGLDYAIGVAGMIYCWAMPIGMWFWSQRLLVTKYLEFGFRKAMTNPVGRFFVPDGFFLPEQYSGALGQLREGTKSHMIVKYLQINGFTLIGAIRAETVPECIALYSCLAVWFMGFAVYAAVLQPSKAPVFNLCAFALDFEMALIAIGCAIWAADREFGVQVVTKLLLLQNATGALVSVCILGINVVEKLFWRPRELRERASAAVVAVLGEKRSDSEAAEEDAADKASSETDREFDPSLIAPDLDALVEAATGLPAPEQTVGSPRGSEDGGGGGRNEGGEGDIDAALGPSLVRRSTGADDPFRLDFEGDEATDGSAEMQRNTRHGDVARRDIGGTTHLEATGAYTRRVRMQDEEEDRAVLDLLDRLGTSRGAPPGPGDATSSGRPYTREEKFLMSMPDPTGMLHPWDVDADSVAREYRERAEQQRKAEKERRHRDVYGQTTSDWLGLADDGFFSKEEATSGMWADDAMNILGVQTPALPHQEGGPTTAAAGGGAGEPSMLSEAEREELQRLAAWQPQNVQEALDKFDRMERLQNPWSVDNDDVGIPNVSRGRSSGTGHVSAPLDSNSSGSAGDRTFNGTGSPSPQRMGTTVEANVSLRTFLQSAGSVDANDDDALANITDEQVLGPVLSNPRNARQRFEAALRLEQFREHVQTTRRLSRGREAIDRVLDRPTEAATSRSGIPTPRQSGPRAQSKPADHSTELWDIL